MFIVGPPRQRDSRQVQAAGRARQHDRTLRVEQIHLLDAGH
jgi:hypothetical protein